jgi:S-formylglutathione hydrolase FrmB
MTHVAGRSAPTWLDGFGEWSWPGLKPAVELTPASWVPALPLRLEAPAVPVRLRVERPRPLPRPLRLARLVMLLAVAGATFALSSHLLAPAAVGPAATVGPSRFDETLTSPIAGSRVASSAAVATEGLPAPPLPRPVTVSVDATGSTIASISFDSAALGHADRFLVYLPPGYAASSARRYPVLYLLHGYEQPASSFLTLGLQPTLDRLISSHTIAPMIAVMLQGANSPEGWLDIGRARFYDYVGEVQRLSDRVLRTVPDRAARGIAGYSMGGFGAMNVALRQLRRYSLVESWEGDFANLSGELRADRPLLRRLPLRAFVWGGAQDSVVDTAADAPWAAALRAAGARAQSAVYPGAHAFAPIERHLRAMLIFAGRSLRA